MMQQMELAVSQWQHDEYAIPWEGSATVLLATVASRRPTMMRVRVLGQVKEEEVEPLKAGESKFSMYTVSCRVPGEKRAWPIAIERFEKVGK